jgi:hypothetical protein
MKTHNVLHYSAVLHADSCYSPNQGMSGGTKSSAAQPPHGTAVARVLGASSSPCQPLAIHLAQVHALVAPCYHVWLAAALLAQQLLVGLGQAGLLRPHCHSSCCESSCCCHPCTQTRWRQLQCSHRCCPSCPESLCCRLDWCVLLLPLLLEYCSAVNVFY